MGWIDTYMKCREAQEAARDAMMIDCAKSDASEKYTDKQAEDEPQWKRQYDAYVEKDNQAALDALDYVSQVELVTGKSGAFISYMGKIAPIKYIQSIECKSHGSKPGISPWFGDCFVRDASPALISAKLLSGVEVIFECNRHVVDFVLDDLRYAWINGCVRPKE